MPRFTKAMEDQAMLPWTSPVIDIAGMALLAAGAVLVLSSFWALGFINTFLGMLSAAFLGLCMLCRQVTTIISSTTGDYFGFLLPTRLTCFPFNVLSDPMYVGSSLAFLGHAFR